MVHFKNRYMVMEVFIDAGRGEPDPVILTQFNVTKVIRDSIQLNFGECGLAAPLGSLQGSIRACKTAALECDEAKFEQYKLAAGDCITLEIILSVVMFKQVYTRRHRARDVRRAQERAAARAEAASTQDMAASSG